MNVYCPYTNLQYATEVTLRLEEPNTHFVYCGNSEYDYFNMLKDAWARKETFILVEHDMVIWPTALQKMWPCQEQLCAYHAPSSLNADGTYAQQVGILKYHQSLMEEFPEHLEEVKEERRRWGYADWALTWRLFDKNVGIHSHEPWVSHIHRTRFWLPNQTSALKTLISEEV